MLFIFYGLLFYSYFVLPENVAIHFSLDGEPNSWMSKATYVISIGIFGAFASSLVIGSYYIIRNSSKDSINIPNREYWLAPERIQQTISDLMNYCILFSSVLLFIFIGIGFLVLNANQYVVVHSLPFKYGIVLLLLPLVILLWKFFRHFRITG
jgi:hypothetical protein